MTNIDITTYSMTSKQMQEMDRWRQGEGLASFHQLSENVQSNRNMSQSNGSIVGRTSNPTKENSRLNIGH